MTRIARYDPVESREIAFLEWRQGGAKTVEISDVSVDNNYRRQGLASDLLHEMMRTIPRDTVTIYAITRASNMIAQEFYESHRFRVCGLLRDFYKDEEQKKRVDAIMFALDLDVT